MNIKQGKNCLKAPKNGLPEFWCLLEVLHGCVPQVAEELSPTGHVSLKKGGGTLMVEGEIKLY